MIFNKIKCFFKGHIYTRYRGYYDKPIKGETCTRCGKVFL